MIKENAKIYDINKFPKDWGIIVFPISMSRIANAQSPEECIKALGFFLEKIQTNRVGANFVYSEGLYMNFEEKAYETKNKFAQDSISHMQGVRNLVAKNHWRFQIDHAFSFQAWFQMYLAYKDFISAMKTVRALYDNDVTFQKVVELDARSVGRLLDEKQLNFFLEEFTFTYLLINRELRLSNEFVNDREQWVLEVYPGKPLLGQAYLVQQDPLKINDDSNPYKGQYNLLTNKFIPYSEFGFEL